MELRKYIMRHSVFSKETLERIFYIKFNLMYPLIFGRNACNLELKKLSRVIPA